jgi:hypothetical protein
MRTALVASLLWLAVSRAAWGAPPKLTYLFPPGAQRGQTVAVAANGSWDPWPVSAWVDRPGLQLTAESKQGQFQATVAGDAEPGVYWVRLFNADGAAALKPFLVGLLPECTEQEPNDDPAKPQIVEAPIVVNGRLGTREDVDTYSVQLQKGQTLIASLQANQVLGSAVDAVLQICSADRFVLEQNNDSRGLDPELTFTAPADGVYLVRIAFSGNDAYLYRLTLTTGGFVDHAFPLAVSRIAATDVELRGWNIPETARRLVVAPTDRDYVIGFHPELANSLLLPVLPHPSEIAAPDSGPPNNNPQSLVIPVTITGVIESPRDEDVFAFSAQKGQTIRFDVESDVLGFPLDAALAVSDSSGKVLSEVDDVRRARDPQVNFSAPADGEYSLTIRDVHGHGGFRYVYRLTAREPKPDFELKLPGDAFAVKMGGSTEIAVTIERTTGFEQEVEISALGLPAGVSAAPVLSLAKGETAKSVKLVVAATHDAHSGAFQVVGRSSGDPPLVRRARLGGEGIPPHVSHAWLTTSAAGR